MANEPTVKKSSCSYCGNAPVNHTLSFLESMVFVTLDNHAKKFLKYVPLFVTNFVDLVPEFLYRTLVFCRLAEFSGDMERAGSFRSKIIWEEARRRGIKMEQVIFLGKPLDQYRAMLEIGEKRQFFYFESIPIQPEFLDMSKNWDDKMIMKREFEKHGIPIPAYSEFSIFSFLSFKKNLENIFSKFKKPIIVKPRVGSRGRHTIININNLEQFREGIDVAGQICSHLIVEEHLEGSVCRATLVDGRLAGFYKGTAPTLEGDGRKTIQELIEELDKKRASRVEPIRISKELHEHISRAGFSVSDILPAGETLVLSHRMGRFFGGKTIEMIDSLHPSFIPVFEKVAKVTGLSVVGFDAIIKDPAKPANTQRWGIIECNTLPFIDLHYYALEGKPKNIAGMIWDLWE
ncbi:hypothetical protein A3H53_03775 [Candidatus Nomurabacteria bacterium RIFCSPLOWO2_02_FULL_40_10]|uniref:ATP-grasp domain-containing protein n=1 Tax=Candidatus Nomurabacteria bacterium RIFCSPLOWO2_02_FULL_40_10 TaxID=1801786 RepID=A0A1F6XVT8_9BACT|nr:MAG: hypothetical protein A3H53_03775 [Candidatus Nomurabacteria bacterium RIFCSPLOWO2_02_FULL_40_10]